MIYKEYCRRLDAALTALQVPLTEARALRLNEPDMVHAAYMRAHAVKNVATALVKLRDSRRFEYGKGDLEIIK